ncbi:MAG: type II toxin-antitoxin system VapC family toxin [Rhodanobacter sp.]|nr:MAG: type II toxin-antitoxin system VapC family toxin [Rhodanobacter sp.]TAM03860.1 MAG: type II toxin-antitoxin system VapC family toxin [Rhodanobacter sp.]TAM38639.1 MAG: type II toxin-antitoxin system VapC family toxin [Rhodanobacter sp.]TAN23664.1 MAG: type II toxin-antitoxin system VapC family toxin [Rhodanobacter sp.]
MIVLDTNVISELFKPVPDPQVMSWVGSLPGDDVFTTAITRGELLFGLFCMPAGPCRNDLQQGLTRLFEQKLAGHVLPYDGDAADAHAAIAVARCARGRASSQSDAMVGGIVHSRGATLATRNVRDFEDCGIALVDPWH